MDIFNIKSKIIQYQFEKLLNPHLDTLYRIAFSYMKDKTNAEDILQDSILIAYEKFFYLKDKNKFGSWITYILINKCKETLRRNNIIYFEQYHCNYSNTFEDTSNQYTHVDTNIDLLNYINLLDNKYKDVIILKYFGDYSIKQISMVLEIPEGTVKSRLNFSMKKLKTIMSKEGFLYNEL